MSGCTGECHGARRGASSFATKRLRCDNYGLLRPAGWGGYWALYAAGTGAAQLCPPDRAAVRHLPHRFSRADSLRPALQALRLYDWRWKIPHDPISKLTQG